MDACIEIGYGCTLDDVVPDGQWSLDGYTLYEIEFSDSVVGINPGCKLLFSFGSVDAHIEVSYVHTLVVVPDG